MGRGTSAKLTEWTIVAVGVFVVLVGVATLVGMPWRYTAAGAVGMVVQIVGSVGAIGIGAGLAWLGVSRVRAKR